MTDWNVWARAIEDKIGDVLETETTPAWDALPLNQFLCGNCTFEEAAARTVERMLERRTALVDAHTKAIDALETESWKNWLNVERVELIHQLHEDGFDLVQILRYFADADE